MSKLALVIGGNGALGSNLVATLNSKSWTTISIDLHKSSAAHHSLLLGKESLEKSCTLMNEQVKSLLKSSKLDLIAVVAGGWCGGNASDDGFPSQVMQMWQTSAEPAVMGAFIAARSLKEKGLVVFTGAVPALGATPGMIGYGMAKAAVHHLTKSLSSSLPNGAKACAILPVTLDTPNNRKYMPDADTTTWTPLTLLSEEIILWASGAKEVTNGALIKVETSNGKTTFTNE